MADGDLNLSRRALLGVAFVAPVLSRVEGPVLASRLPSHAELVSASSPPPAGSTTSWTLKQVQGDGVGEWHRALGRFRRAEAAFAAATSLPDEALYDRLGERCDRALTRLLHTPAPDVAALALKLDLTLYERFGEFLGDSAAMKALKQDARRLAAASA
jgi:hypothetical protein